MAFDVNILVRISSDPTKEHWDRIKRIFRYFRGIIDLGQFFPKSSNRSWLDMRMLGTCQTLILDDIKRFICLHIIALLSFGSL